MKIVPLGLTAIHVITNPMMFSANIKSFGSYDGAEHSADLKQSVFTIELFAVYI